MDQSFHEDITLRGKSPDVYRGTLETKFGASLVIFCISLLAVSFPALSKRIKSLRVPTLVFFLGKHFGTGVILSTAFVHLLADAFKALKSEWTGLIVLVSLLAIFLVEYISTAYVDHLHSYSSAPPTPTPSSTPSTSRAQSLVSTNRGLKQPSPPGHVEDIDIDSSGRPQRQREQEDASDVPSTHTETTPLRQASSPPSPYGTHRSTPQDTDAVLAFPRHSPAMHVVGVPEFALQSTEHEHEPEELDASVAAVLASGDRDEIFGGGHHRHEPREAHASHTLRSKKIAAVVLLKNEGQEQVGEGPGVPAHHHHHHHGHGHVDIENWAGDEEGDGDVTGEGEADGLLHHGHDHAHAHEGHLGHREQVTIGRRRQVVGILMLQIGIMLHSLVIGLTLAITTGPEFTTLVTAILFHQLFEGLSLGIRIAALPSSAVASSASRLLKPSLAMSFAFTTPFGIFLGLFIFAGASRNTDSDSGRRLLHIQGIMSAMSAGMLIYAACVEMLAGDFVMDPLMWRSGLRRQVMALASLATGVCAMALVGMWD